MGLGMTQDRSGKGEFASGMAEGTLVSFVRLSEFNEKM